MDVHDRGLLYYRLLKFNVKEAHRVVCGQTKMVAEENTVIPRLSLFPEFNTLSVMYSKHSDGFITQECPYILGSDTSQRGAESNFDLLLETSSQTSSGSHSPAPSPQVPRKEGHREDSSVIEIPSAPIPNTPPAILLNPKPSITAGDFEKKWIAMPKK